MSRIAIVAGMLLAGLLCGCDSPTDDGAVGPGPITAPQTNARILAGDTIEVAWTNALESPVISCNYNDTAAIYNDAQWHAFADSEIVSINSTSARVRIRLHLYAMSSNFRIQVADAASGTSSETGPMDLDHIVLLSPVAGESFTVGQTVPVRIKRNRYMDRVYVHFVTGAGGSTSFSLTAQDINFDERGLGSVTSVLDTNWVIGGESYSAGKSPEYPSDSCFFYVFSYYLGAQFRGDPVGMYSDHNDVPFSIAR